MPARVSTNTPQLKWDVGVNNTYSMSAWLRRVGNGGSSPASGTACYPAMALYDPGGGSPRAHLAVRVSDGLWGVDRSSDWGFSVFTPNVGRADEWVFGAITVNSGVWKVYLGTRSTNKLAMITDTDTQTDWNVAVFGVDDWGGWFNGEYAYLKLWDAVLTEQELSREMYTAMPITQVAALKYYQPCITREWHLKAVPWATAPNESAIASSIGVGVPYNIQSTGTVIAGKMLYETIDEVTLDENDYARLTV